MGRRFIQWKPTTLPIKKTPKSYQNQVIHTINVGIWVILFEILELSVILSEGNFYFSIKAVCCCISFAAKLLL